MNGKNGYVVEEEDGGEGLVKSGLVKRQANGILMVAMLRMLSNYNHVTYPWARMYAAQSLLRHLRFQEPSSAIMHPPIQVSH